MVELECLPQVHKDDGIFVFNIGKMFGDDISPVMFDANARMVYGIYGRIYRLDVDMDNISAGVDSSRLEGLSLPSCIEMSDNHIRAKFPIDDGISSVIELVGRGVLFISDKRISNIMLYPHYYVYKSYGTISDVISLALIDKYDNVFTDGVADVDFYVDSAGRLSRVDIKFRSKTEGLLKTDNTQLNVSYKEGLLSISISGRDVAKKIGTANDVWAVVFTLGPLFASVDIYDVDNELSELIRLV